VVELEDVVVRVPKETIEKLREMFPELKDEGHAVVVRVALNRLIERQKP